MTFLAPNSPRPFFVPRRLPWKYARDGKGREVAMWYDRDDETVFVQNPSDPDEPWQWDPRIDWLNSDGDDDVDVLNHDLGVVVENFYKEVKHL